MVGKEQIFIDLKVTLDEINVLIKHENNSRVLKRLYFVKFRCLGDSVEEAATKVGVTKKTGYYWQDYWNKGGYAALIPNFGGGAKVQAYIWTNKRIKNPVGKQELLDYKRSFGANKRKIWCRVFTEANRSYIA